MRKLFLLAVAVLVFFTAGGVSAVLNATYDNNEMGKVVVNKKTPLTEQLVQPNTIYEIRRKIDLNGGSLTVPEGCVLKFKRRGRISNGTVRLNNTILEGEKAFQNVVLTGQCANEELSSDLFVLDKKGKTDNSVEVQSLFNVGVRTIRFSKGTYAFSDVRVGDVCIYANGSTFISTLASDEFAVINNIFVANNSAFFKLYDATIQGRLEGSPRIQKVVLSPVDCTNVGYVEIKGCKFRELRYACYEPYKEGIYDYRGVSLSCHGCKEVLVENCEFYDMMPSEWIWITPTASGSWNDVENVWLRNNYFHNPENDIERRNTPVNVFSKNVIFEGNLLEYMKYAGSAFNLQSRNVIVHDNVVRNCYFKSIVDVCEYGDFCNDHVEIYDNDFSAYNSQGVVANSKELIVRNNKFEGISAVLAYATYYNSAVKHAACVDYATAGVMPNQKVIIEGNDCFCHLVDTTWVSGDRVVHGGSCSGITIQSLYCISENVSIRNNRMYIRKIDSEKLGSFVHQPLFVRNARNIDISGNYIDSDVPAIGSRYKGAVYVLVYNRVQGNDARMTEVESLNVVDNEYNLSSEDGTLYPVRVSGYSDNTADWRVRNSRVTGNVLLGPSRRVQIYTTGGNIDNLTVEEGKMDIKNSPAVIKRVLSAGRNL